MGCDVLDPLAIDPDLTIIPQAFEIFRASERTFLIGDDIFWFVHSKGLLQFVPEFPQLREKAVLGNTFQPTDAG